MLIISVSVSVSDIKTELLSASLKPPNSIPKLGESVWNQSDNVQCEHQHNYSNSNSTKIHIPYEPEITILGLEGPHTNESEILENLNAKSETAVIEQVRSNERHKRFKHGTRVRNDLDAMTGVTTLGQMYAQERHTWLHHGNRNIQTKESEITVFDHVQLKEKQTCLLYQHIGDWNNIDEGSEMTTMEQEQAQENQTCPQLGAWSTLEEETGSDVFEEYPEFGPLLDQMPAEPTIPKQTKRSIFFISYMYFILLSATSIAADDIFRICPCSK